MPIYVIDTIKQKNLAVFPLLEDTDLMGGMRVVADYAALSDIPSTYRKLGMLCWTQAESKLWWLSALPDTWTEFAGGGGSGDALTDVLTAGEVIQVGDPVAIDGATGRAIRADAAALSGDRQEVYGLATSAAAAFSPVTVVTSGVLTYPPGGLTISKLLYLGVGVGTGGGFSISSPSLTIPGQRIVRIGQVRTPNSILVRVQIVGVT